MSKFNYKLFIQDNFKIIDKSQQEIPFTLNSIQEKYLEHDMTGRDVILKARQQGFSSLILAMFTADFILKPNTVNYVVADIDDNASDLLQRVKYYLKAYEEITGVKVPLKYNSKTELVNEAMNSIYKIGTAKNAEFGRSKTITNLHLSEFAFYPNPKNIIAGAGQAVVENGRLIIETTANGFNEFKTYWDDSVLGESTSKPLFYKASDFYSQEFLERKKKELKEKYQQEYPDTAEEAFLTSGETYFNLEALAWYNKNTKPPIAEGMIYV
jgi:hypothetical protein